MRAGRRPLPVACGILVAMALGGCSSPSRGPETDVVEVERIEVTAPAPGSGDTAREPDLVLPAADPPGAEDVAPPSPR